MNNNCDRLGRGGEIGHARCFLLHLVVLASVELLMTLAVLAQTAPDPKLLLKGMISSRKQILPSRLWVRQIYSDLKFHSDAGYLIEFDGERRRFTPLSATGDELVQGKIQYDGKEIAMYRDDDVTLSGLDNSQGYFVFDPRVLGLSAGCRAADKIDWFESPGFANLEIVLVGTEKVNGTDVWHVRMIAPHCAFNWWIDDKNSFRVCRYVEDMGNSGRYEVDSSYSESYPSLPKKVVIKNYNAQGTVVEERSIEVVKSDVDVKFADNFWTLIGMRIPTNEITVSDLRSQKVIGYWNGNKIRPYWQPLPPEPFQPAPVTWNSTRVIVIAGLLVFIVAPLAWLFLRSVKGKREN